MTKPANMSPLQVYYEASFISMGSMISIVTDTNEDKLPSLRLAPMHTDLVRLAISPAKYR